MRGIFVFMALVASIGFAVDTSAQPAEELNAIQQRLLDGELEGALQDINTFLRSDPGNPPARFLKGLILKSAKLNAEAIEVYESLVKDLPNHPEPLNNLAVLYAEQRDYERATQALKQLIGDIDPNYAAAYENLGDVYSAWASEMYDKAANLTSKSKNLERKRAYLARFTRPRAPPARTQAATQEPPVRGDPAQLAAADRMQEPEPDGTDFVEARNAITELITRWAQAWSSQDVSGYVASYSDDYAAEGFAGHAAWVRSRRKKISRPKSIHVDVQNLRVEIINDTLAKARLLQGYRSDSYRDRTEKILTFEKSGGQWRIVEEKSIAGGETAGQPQRATGAGVQSHK